jgi:hypothetical protein
MDDFKKIEKQTAVENIHPFLTKTVIPGHSPLHPSLRQKTPYQGF